MAQLGIRALIRLASPLLFLAGCESYRYGSGGGRVIEKIELGGFWTDLRKIRRGDRAARHFVQKLGEQDTNGDGRFSPADVGGSESRATQILIGAMQSAYPQHEVGMLRDFIDSVNLADRLARRGEALMRLVDGRSESSSTLNAVRSWKTFRFSSGNWDSKEIGGYRGLSQIRDQVDQLIHGLRVVWSRAKLAGLPLEVTPDGYFVKKDLSHQCEKRAIFHVLFGLPAARKLQTDLDSVRSVFRPGETISMKCEGDGCVSRADEVPVMIGTDEVKELTINIEPWYRHCLRGEEEDR